MTSENHCLGSCLNAQPTHCYDMLTRSRSQFYQVTSAFRRFELDVGMPLNDHQGRQHRLYGEMSGNPEGPVVLCLHGGPGAGSNPATRQFFDPDHYCIVQFDQRGASRSQPWASMEQNTTDHLVEDIEHIAKELQLDRFILFGGSWGSTLALAYAGRYPERVTAMVLRGIFLGRPRDVEWFLMGLEGVHPEAHAAFVAHLDAAEQTDAKSILAAYTRRLMSSDRHVSLAAAKAWSSYEDAAATLRDNRERKYQMTQFDCARRGIRRRATGEQKTNSSVLAIARCEAHYLSNNLFLPSQGLLACAQRWQHVPGTIVHGRYDMVCQVQGAYELAKAWPKAELKIVDDAGHSTFEDSIADQLLGTMEKMKSLDI